MDIKHDDPPTLFQKDKVVLERESRIADLLFGSISGFAGKLVEYPFDTVKVHLQTQAYTHGQSPFGLRGTLRCVQSIYQREGIHGFFRGLSAPLMGSMVENSVLFISYNFIQDQIKRISNLDQARPLSLGNMCLAGALSGAVVSFVLTPVELIKCQLQVMQQHQARGPFSLLVHTLRNKGILGLYRGHFGTLMREVAGGAAWFGVYESSVKFLLDRNPGCTKQDLSPFSLMTAGALAGMAYNAALFPADVVKSRQQTSSLRNPRFMDVAKTLYRQEGWRGFYRGFGITICRSAPTSGIIFLTYETLSRNFTVEFD
ncbi:mitochondrial carrier domain-containing protein [Gorgonomyces haynaldii]|nr:mitochondrial carrier domain-containing protein [Gorgonomyces haynaldii]